MTPHERHLLAAQGYFELGMYQDADAELEAIEPTDDDARKDVTALRYFLYAATHRWPKAEWAAKTMVDADPENADWWVNWAYATRRLSSIEAAKLILLEAEQKFQNHATIQYNLACYASQLGRFPEARHRINLSISMDPKFREFSKDDPDLAPLWKFLKENEYPTSPDEP